MSRLLMLCACLSLSACHSVTFKLVDGPHASVVSRRNAFFFLGLAPRRYGDAHEMCPHGAASIHEQTTFSDGLFALFTLGIYTPRTSFYYCLPAPADGDAR